MAWADTTRKNSGEQSGLLTVAVSLTGTVAGNFLAAGWSGWPSSGFTQVTVTDTDTNDYDPSFYREDVGSDQAVALAHCQNLAGGDITVTFTSDGSGDYTGFVHEFSGGHTTAAPSGTPATNSGNGTTASTGATTPADNDVLCIAVVGVDLAAAIGAPSDSFNTSNENEGGPGQPGAMAWKIISGAPGTPSTSWTISSADWCAGIAAFKPAAVAGKVTRNTRAQPLGIELGMNRGMQG